VQNLKKQREKAAKLGTTNVVNHESARYLEQRQVASLAPLSEALMAAVGAAENKKAHNTLILDVREVTSLADYFIITGGDSVNQVRAIAEAVDEALGNLGYKCTSIEGKVEGRWVLLDYGDVIVHVLHQKERDFYKLEQFWSQANLVK
jgi:ribosome-associated protein